MPEGGSSAPPSPRPQSSAPQSRPVPRRSPRPQSSAPQSRPVPRRSPRPQSSARSSRPVAAGSDPQPEIGRPLTGAEPGRGRPDLRAAHRHRLVSSSACSSLVESSSCRARSGAGIALAESGTVVGADSTLICESRHEGGSVTAGLRDLAGLDHDRRRPLAPTLKVEFPAVADVKRPIDDGSNERVCLDRRARSRLHRRHRRRLRARRGRLFARRRCRRTRHDDNEPGQERETTYEARSHGNPSNPHTTRRQPRTGA